LGGEILHYILVVDIKNFLSSKTLDNSWIVPSKRVKMAANVVQKLFCYFKSFCLAGLEIFVRIFG